MSYWLLLNASHYLHIKLATSIVESKNWNKPASEKEPLPDKNGDLDNP